MPLTFENNHIYGLLYNNICNTDAPAWQRVLESFSYSLFFHASGFDSALAQSDWNSVIALEGELSFESADEGENAIPDSFRVHTDCKGNCYLENLDSKEHECSLEFRGEQVTVKMKRSELQKI